MQAQDREASQGLHRRQRLPTLEDVLLRTKPVARVLLEEGMPKGIQPNGGRVGVQEQAHSEEQLPGEG